MTEILRCEKGDVSEVLIEDRDSSRTIIAFGGVNGRLGMPPFEWQKITENLDANIVFIRDIEQAWYQRLLGKRYLSRNELSLIDPRLGAIISGRQTITLGNSMGGYAAIAFGSLLGANLILGFSPQTFIDPVSRIRHKDWRWKSKFCECI